MRKIQNALPVIPIDRIKKAFDAPLKDIVKAACDRIWNRIVAVRDAEGVFFERMVF